jgi:hypothetical protein
MLVAAFDGVISILEQVQGPLAENEFLKQRQLLTAQQLILALYEGIDVRYGAVPENMQKLYLFVLSCIGMGPKLDLPAAMKIMRTIRSGLETIRDEANEMERRGDLIPAAQESQVLRHLIA